MKIQVIINYCVAYEEPVTAYGVEKVADLLGDAFRIPLLRSCKVMAEIRIVDVPSRMNSGTFQPEPEPYDEIFFKEIVE